MKLVVIGGTGRIGSKVVDNLREHGHEARIGCAPNRNSCGLPTTNGVGQAKG